MDGKRSSLPVVLAVDLGGTRLRVALVRGDGQLDARREVPTPTGGPEAVVTAIAALAAQIGGSPALAAIAAPGPLDPATGVMYATPNLRGFDGFPLGAAVGRAVGLPAVVHNDANLAALGEWHFGAGRGADPLLYLTVSTGVGGGIIRGGRIEEGRHGLAGELGHMIVAADGPRCNFGHAGCLEALASGTALAARAAEALANGETTAIRDFAGPDGITARAVAAAAAGGDDVALRLIRRLGRNLGLAVGSLVNAFDPAAVVVGGGLCNAWELFAVQLLDASDEVIMSPSMRPELRIARAEMAEDAGLIGAALWALGEVGG